MRGKQKVIRCSEALMTRSNFSYWTQSRELHQHMGIQSNSLPREPDNRSASLLLKPLSWKVLGKKGDASQPHVGGAFFYEALSHSFFLRFARLLRWMFELPQCRQTAGSISYSCLSISTPVRSFKMGLNTFPLIRSRISVSFFLFVRLLSSP